MSDNVLHLRAWSLDRIDRKIARTEGEKKISAITKETYSLAELGTLNRHATPLERLALYLGLNCAMGAAEMGRLVTGDIILDKPHDHADRLHFQSTEADSFVCQTGAKLPMRVDGEFTAASSPSR